MTPALKKHNNAGYWSLVYINQIGAMLFMELPQTSRVSSKRHLAVKYNSTDRHRVYMHMIVAHVKNCIKSVGRGGPIFSSQLHRVEKLFRVKPQKLNKPS